MTTYSYVPMLETRSGSLYLSNNGTTTMAIQAGADPNAMVSQGVVAFQDSDSNYQGRLSISYSAPNFLLGYNGEKWSVNAPDNLMMNIVKKDIAAASASGQSLDIYGVNGTSGGSTTSFYVWALGWPEVASVSPTSVPADGMAHSVTIMLKRRLHSTQAPNVTFAEKSAGGHFSMTSIEPIRNDNNQITGYKMFVTASAASATAAFKVVMTATETLKYLKGDVIVTESVTYCNNVEVGGLTITGIQVVAPVTVLSRLLTGGSGSDTKWGTLKTSANLSGSIGYFAGGLSAVVSASSGSSYTFGRTDIIAKPSGSGAYRVIATDMGVAGASTLDSQGNTLYIRNYTFNFDTNQLNSSSRWDIGYICYDNTGYAVVAGADMFGTYLNGNLTEDLASYKVYASGGTYEWGWTQQGMMDWWDYDTYQPIQPKFSGLLKMYISESWNLFNQWGGAPTGATNNWDSLSFTVGGHQYTVGTPNPNARVIINGDYAYPLFNSAGYTVDTTTLSNGNYEVVATLGDTSQQHNGTPARVITIPFTVNNTVVPVDLPTLTLTAPTSISFNQTLDPYTGHALDVRSIIQIKGTYLDGKPVTLAMDGMPLNSVGFFTISAPTMTNGACSSVFIFNADGVTLGNYTLTLTATCGTVVKTANISLGVSNSSGTVGTKPTITSFVANPLSLISGNSGTLTPVFVNGTLAEIDNGVGTVTSGQIVTVGPLTGSKTYTLTVYNSAGSVSQQATFSVSGLPVITAFMAQPQSLLMNNDNYSSLFAWYSGGIGTVDWGLGEISGEGAPLTAGWLTDSRTYTLTVTNSVGSVTRQTTISNGTVPIIFSFQSGSPTNSIASGTSTTITPMFSQGGDGPWGEGFIEGIGVVANAEPINTGVLTANKTYKLKVTNAWGYVEQSLTITMNAPAPPPGPTITSFGPADLTIGSGGSVTLTAIFTGTGVVTPRVGAVTSGVSFTTPTMTSSTVFTLTVTNAYGSVSQSVTVTIPTGGGGSGCVPAGTPILTVEGFVPVESLKIGDKVLGFDENSMASVTSPVTNTWRYADRQIYEIVTSEGTLICSHDHRLAVVSKDGTFTYPAARDLSKKDIVLAFDQADGLRSAVVLNVNPTDTYADVFHMTLREGHAFVAGGFVAHNKIQTQSSEQY